MQRAALLFALFSKREEHSAVITEIYIFFNNETALPRAIFSFL